MEQPRRRRNSRSNSWRTAYESTGASSIAGSPAVVLAEAAAGAGADLAIVDTAGRTNDAAAAAARAADIILIPLQPSLIDLKTLGATFTQDSGSQGVRTRIEFSLK